MNLLPQNVWFMGGEGKNFIEREMEKNVKILLEK